MRHNRYSVNMRPVTLRMFLCNPPPGAWPPKRSATPTPSARWRVARACGLGRLREVGGGLGLLRLRNVCYPPACGVWRVACVACVLCAVCCVLRVTMGSNGCFFVCSVCDIPWRILLVPGYVMSSPLMSNLD